MPEEIAARGVAQAPRSGAWARAAAEERAFGIALRLSFDRGRARAVAAAVAAGPAGSTPRPELVAAEAVRLLREDRGTPRPPAPGEAPAWGVLRRLPPADREAAVLRLAERLPVAAVAEACGLSPAEVGARLAAVRRDLADAVAPPVRPPAAGAAGAATPAPDARCAAILPTLDAARDGAIPAAQAEAVRAHLHACVLCAVVERDSDAAAAALFSLPGDPGGAPSRVERVAFGMPLGVGIGAAILAATGIGMLVTVVVDGARSGGPGGAQTIVGNTVPAPRAPAAPVTGLPAPGIAPAPALPALPGGSLLAAGDAHVRAAVAGWAYAAEDGAPLAGVRATLVVEGRDGATGNRRLEATTTASGWFLLWEDGSAPLPPTARLRLERPAADGGAAELLADRPLRLPPAGRAALLEEIFAGPGGPLVAALRRPDGSPAAGAELRAWPAPLEAEGDAPEPPRGAGGGPPAPFATAIAGPDGVATIASLPAGEWLVAAAEPGATAPPPVEIEVGLPGAPREPVPLLVEPPVALEGRAFDASGVPAAGAAVEAWLPADDEPGAGAFARGAAAVAGPDGRWRLEGLPRGAWAVVLRDADGIPVAGARAALPAVRNLDLRAAPRVPRAALVHDAATGAPFHGAAVVAVVGDAGSGGAVAAAIPLVSGADGTLPLPPLPAAASLRILPAPGGPLRDPEADRALLARSGAADAATGDGTADAAPPAAPTAFALWRPTVRELRPPRRAGNGGEMVIVAASGRPTDWDARRAKAVPVEGECVLASEGVARRVEGLPPGSLRADVVRDGATPGNQGWGTRHDGASIPVPFDDAARAPLQVSVTDASGRPARAMVRVHAYALGVRPRRAVTDAQGVARFFHMPQHLAAVRIDAAGPEGTGDMVVPWFFAGNFGGGPSGTSRIALRAAPEPADLPLPPVDAAAAASLRVRAGPRRDPDAPPPPPGPRPETEADPLPLAWRLPPRADGRLDPGALPFAAALGVRLEVTADGHGAVRLLVLPGAGPAGLSFPALEPTASFRGRLVDASGSPIAGAAVGAAVLRIARGAPWTPGSPIPHAAPTVLAATTGDDGAFRLALPAAGSIPHGAAAEWIEVLLPGGERRLVPLPAGDGAVEVPAAQPDLHLPGDPGAAPRRRGGR